MEMLGYSSISETVLGLTFLARRSVAHVCRKSWNLTSGSFARLRSDAKDRRLKFVGFRGAPASVAKASPWSS